MVSFIVVMFYMPCMPELRGNIVLFVCWSPSCWLCNYRVCIKKGDILTRRHIVIISMPNYSIYYVKPRNVSYLYILICLLQAQLTYLLCLRERYIIQTTSYMWFNQRCRRELFWNSFIVGDEVLFSIIYCTLSIYNVRQYSPKRFIFLTEMSRESRI